MAARRKHKPRRTPAAATPKPAPTAAAAPAAPVQTQAAEAAAEALIADAHAKAEDVTRKALNDASAAVSAANDERDKLISAAEQAVAELQDKASDEAERLISEAKEAAEQARQTLDRAKADAAWTAEETKGLRARSLASANHEAKQIVEAAHAATEHEKKRDDAFDTWSARLVIAGTVGLTASGEYALARMVGFDKPVAWLLPFVIDVYVIQAFRRHRDIVQAIALTVAANVIFHLADKGLFGVEKVARDGNEPKWWLIAMVASVASVILWRMHSITAPPKAEREPKKEQQDQAQSPPEQLPVDARPERVERPAEASVSAPAERAQAPAVERPAERSGGRPRKPKSERAQGAHPKPKKSASKPIAERRQERVVALYSELGKRPEWTDIRDALADAKLADKSISRSSCQRIRDAVEADQPHLAAFGSDNVRSITGGSA